ncbi:energy-coupled thiamine transporter ThiT [Lactococcus termiticola]|uniref:Thiamine transporter ThiT n=1 Tax=Lactococcus termiticola TaxID=2169526 RepID=A0A2R5HIU6_9LACT|nr:energy-coupled thiamine transporter ThiT [Lactococcus termiticola]GBG96011.1 thiamine transporter ThiT [Lactococcus termiticola]
MSNLRTRLLAEVALAAALATVLNFIPHTFFGWMTMEIGVLPILLLGYRRGPWAGMAGGLVWGLLTIALGQAFILVPAQAILEYILAPIITGATGFFSKKNIGFVGLGILVVVLIKYVIHFLAGIIFWSSFAWPGYSATLYSLIVNSVSGLITAGFAVIAGLILIKRFPKLLG